MKLKNIIYGMMCVATLGSCSDKMEYHEYNNYDEDFVKLNFGNVGGLITNIYLSIFLGAKIIKLRQIVS